MVTRWFRAPELLLKYGLKNYSSKIDMWSAGCVLAELYLSRVLFGKSSMHKQLKAIVSLLGLPGDNILDKIEDPEVKVFLKQAYQENEKISFKQLFPEADADALDLLQRLLTYDPDQRLSAADALAHPFFAELHDPNDEETAEPLSYFDFEFENYSLDKKILRELILDEILLYHNKNAFNYYSQCKLLYPNGVLEIIYQRTDNQREDIK